MDETRDPAIRRDRIAIGASAGGLDALKTLVSGLTVDLPAALLVVLHVHPEAPDLLPGILQRCSPLPVSTPADHTPIEAGHIYVAPPDLHLLVEDDELRVVRGPRENLHRPAIDPLFRSAAAAFGRRLVGIVLTGTLDDGAAGLWAVKSSGGVAVVQDPDEAEYPEMPAQAMHRLDVDYRLPLAGIAQLITRLAWGGEGLRLAVEGEASTAASTSETMMDDQDMRLDAPGKLSAFTCPSCGGALWELDEGGMLNYRCHVGHAFSAEALDTAQADGVEEALYSALRALKERAALARRMTERYSRGLPRLQARYEEEMRDLERQAATLQRLLSDRRAA